MPPSSKVSEAFSVLGIEESSSLELVKTTYKQIALRIHPDKNPNSPSATEEFQRVSDAYRVLVKHFDQSSRPSNGYHSAHAHSHPYGGHPFFGFGFPSHDGYSTDHDDEGSDEYGPYAEDLDSDEEIYRNPFAEEPEEDIQSFFAEKLYREYARRAHRSQRQAKEESPEAYQERLRRSHEERLAAQERRKQEAIARKERAAREREEERIQAELRQKNKIEAKKAQAQAARKSSETRAKEIQRKAQLTRSSVFTAARNGQGEKVKKGIWEDAVDAAGGEFKTGCSTFVQTEPHDQQETLLHIATRKGDADLVKWLDSHGADPEEKDSQGLSAFQVALKTGQLAIVNYFLETYPPTDSDHQPIYDCNDSMNLISMAVESREPQHVWIILENKLATSEQIRHSWAWVTSNDGLQVLRGPMPKPEAVEKAEDIIKLLTQYGGLSSLNTPERPPDPKFHQLQPSQEVFSKETAQTYTKPMNHRGRVRGKFRGRGRSSVPPSH